MVKKNKEEEEAKPLFVIGSTWTTSTFICFRKIKFATVKRQFGVLPSSDLAKTLDDGPSWGCVGEIF